MFETTAHVRESVEVTTGTTMSSAWVDVGDDDHGKVTLFFHDRAAALKVRDAVDQAINYFDARPLDKPD